MRISRMVGVAGFGVLCVLGCSVGGNGEKDAVEDKAPPVQPQKAGREGHEQSGGKKQPTPRPEIPFVGDKFERTKTSGPRPDKGQGVVATCAAFSPDNKFVLVGFGGGSVKKQPKRTALADCLILYDVASGKEIRTLKGHPGGVRFVYFFPDGIRAVSSGSDGCYRVWDIRSGTELWKIEATVKGPRGVLSSDGKHLVAYHGSTLEFWDIIGGKRLQTAEFLEEDINSVILSESGDIAFISGRTSYLWDVKEWRSLTTFKLSIGRPAAFSPDGKYLVVRTRRSDKNSLVLWDVAKHQEIRELGDKDLKPINVTFSSDGKIVARSDEGRLVCWNTEAKFVWETKSKDLEHLPLFVFSKDRKFALSNYGGLFVDGEMRPAFIDKFESTFSLRIWNLEKGTLVTTLSLPKLPEATETKGKPK